MWFNELGFQPTQFISVTNDLGETLTKKEILGACGSLFGGLTLEDNDRIGNIRCFEQDSLFNNFGPFWPAIPCDTVWTEIISDVHNSLESSNLILLPNPVDDIFTLQGLTRAIENYQIINFRGSIVSKGEIKKQIDVSHLPHGHYFIRLFDIDFNYASLKFIKL